MSDTKPSFREMFGKLMEQFPTDPFKRDTLIMSSRERIPFETGQMRESWKGIGEVNGVKVVTSDYVEPGQFYLVDTKALAFKIPDLEGFRTDLVDEIRRRIAQALGVPSRYWEFDKPYVWQRRPGEKLLIWSARLSDRGLLDNPDIRWEFQKATFQIIFQMVKKLVRRA